ncbi:TPA: GGDEF domain-containing protein, partial [Vibrio vulnificus]|nr:GGDEF domain-containing protein [Vibrio vulnificus]
MNFRSFMRKVSATRDHRLLAETMFEYLAELMEVDAMAIFDDPCVNTSLSLRFWSGQPAPLVDFPSSFWQWARQFDTSESLIPLAINTCNWDHRDLLGGNSYIMMLDNFPMLRTYILIQGVKAGSADHIYEKTHDAMQLIAARWQCIRAEKQASLEIKNRDIREAQYIDEINHRERFIDNMKLVQEVALEISNPSTLNDLYRKAVEALRDRLG